MSAITLRPQTPKPKPAKVYPESDGLTMADDTKQFDWITLVKWNLEILYRDEPNVFVAGNLLWYPVEGFEEIRAAPDALVAYGRPKGRAAATCNGKRTASPRKWRSRSSRRVTTSWR